MSDDRQFEDLEGALRSNRLEPSHELVDTIARTTAAKRPTASRARRSLSILFAVLVLSATVVGAAFADKGGNGGGSNGGGNGDGGHPAGCVEGNGNAGTQNPNC